MVYLVRVKYHFYNEAGPSCPVFLFLAHRSLNLQIQTSDNLKLGAWLVLPPNDVPPLSIPEGPPSIQAVQESLSTRPTILIFHGNAATRAVGFRIQHVTTYSKHFSANVVAVDYRGYGDSEGSPSEKGLIVDAHAAWDWVLRHGAKPKVKLVLNFHAWARRLSSIPGIGRAVSGYESWDCCGIGPGSTAGGRR